MSRRWLAIAAAAAAVSSAAVAGCAESASGGSPQVTTAVPPPSPANLSVTRTVIIGDSLSTGAHTPGYPWTTPAQALLDRDHVPIELVNISGGGAGYLARGERNWDFLDAARVAVTPDTGIVVVFGSDNDSLASGLLQPAYAGEVRHTLDWIVRRAPHARLVIVGPPATPADPASQLLAIRDTLRAAAQRLGAIFVDAISWFAGANARFVGPDGEHPDRAGEDYLAAKFVAILEPLAR